ncbi:MAG: hypothetical protein ABS95_00885 [Verrucomicrobia bacterium SCN 57-15]|nr:MAG: hypothetical protein ABS95_00885 [Verrucomicrobia bacterium SCN 57-15]
MTRSRQYTLNPLLRISAALLVFVWLAATSLCSAEHLMSHAESAVARDSGSAADHHEAASSDTDSGHSHDSDKHDGDQHSCCDSPKILPQSSQSGLLAKPDFGKPFSLSSLWLAQALTIVEAHIPPALRQATERNWAFTPEVSLGPAFRSHAPPVLA